MQIVSVEDNLHEMSNPIFLNIYIFGGYLEETLFEKKKKKKKKKNPWAICEFRNEFIQNWKGFLNSCFVSWIKSRSELLELKDILNKLHSDITFTVEYSNVQQPFLDVLVKQVGTKIETDICCKLTDSKQYLLFNSCHPKHNKTSFTYSLAQRSQL